MTIGQLMKNLRAKGWIPRGYNEVIHTVYDKKHKTIGLYKEGKKYLELVYKKSLRQLVSKESGLWQFVCENGMVKEDDGHITRIINLYKSDETIVDGGWNYHYWLMICSILDESELEEFLLNNIKIDENTK